MDIGKESNEIYPDYDFMSFQEVSIKQIMRMDFPNGFINNYKIVYMAVSNNTVSIFYNKNTILLKNWRKFNKNTGPSPIFDCSF